MSDDTDRERREFFIENLSILSTPEYEEIFRILKRNGVEWSENCNGIFFDVNRLSIDIFDKLYVFMEYCLEQRKEEQTRIVSLNEFKKEIKDSF